MYVRMNLVKTAFGPEKVLVVCNTMFEKISYIFYEA